MLTSDLSAHLSINDVCEPCAFRAIWFSNSLFLVLTNRDGDPFFWTVKTLYKAAVWLRRSLFSMFNTKLYFLLSIQLHSASLSNIAPCIWTKSRAKRGLSQRMTSPHKMESMAIQRSYPKSITSLPAEIRHKILEHLVMDDTMVKVVGWSDCIRNRFLVKQRGYCPLPAMLTCRQFHLDMQYVYFKNMFVVLKAACPSAFDEDMANFASDYFKNNIRAVEISDPDLQRRNRIASAFPGALIEYKSSGSSGSRKGAYYFS